MRPPAQCAVLFPGFKQLDQLVGDRRSGDLSHSAATHDRLERFGQIAGRMDHVATVQFLPASDFGMVKDGWTCVCYAPEVGNVPKQGDNLSWSESSAINYVNFRDRNMLRSRAGRAGLGLP